MAKIIDGKKISAEIKEELKTEVAAYAAQGKKCALAVIQVGADPASSVYVRNKKKACAYIGIESLSYELPEETTEEELLALIQKLNDNPDVHGILCQLPLPKHICEDHVIQAIDKPFSNLAEASVRSPMRFPDLRILVPSKHAASNNMVVT